MEHNKNTNLDKIIIFLLILLIIMIGFATRQSYYDVRRGTLEEFKQIQTITNSEDGYGTFQNGTGTITGYYTEAGDQKYLTY